jgi:hypothetical protein
MDAAARRAERRAEAQMRRERDNPESPERRAAALEAQRRRYPSDYPTHSSGGF